MSEAREEEHIEKQRSQCLRWDNLICRNSAWPRDFIFSRAASGGLNDGGLAAFSGHLVHCQGSQGGPLIDDTQVIHILSKANLGFQSVFRLKHNLAAVVLIQYYVRCWLGLSSNYKSTTHGRSHIFT